ncbi:MAG: tRNA (N(6)-L-threonylcarbamoyladenosine(37)-C(2))-methylthiotransferase MtaB [Candidatus Promineifilaceae bacterium]
MKVFLDSIGCRLNQSEIETMARQLLAAGHEIVSSAAEADKVVLNTCAVTKEATKDTKSKVRRFHRANDSAEIIVTGCHATLSPDSIAVLPGVSNVVVNKDKLGLVHRIDPTASLDLPVFDREPIIRDFMANGMGNTRAFIKVQDGCKNKCTFCVTTVARGDSVSRHTADVITEIQNLAAAGYKEAVLTGVHLGSYGHDFGNRTGLRDLVRMIFEHTDIPRLRLSSLEPWEIAPDFFTLWDNPRLLPHLHLPLQAGSNRTLRRMARNTTQEKFRQLTIEARAAIPNLNLTTDVICGFPAETEADFDESLAYVEEIGFSRLHVFTYSPRPGTAAATMSGHLPNVTKKARTHRMIALGKQMGLAFHKQYEGRTMNVLWEAMAGSDDNGIRWSGYTDNYMRVFGYGDASLMNAITPTVLSEPSADGLHAVVV